MRNWPSSLVSLLTADPTQITWAELYTITLSTPTYQTVFDQFNLGAITSFWTGNGGTFGVVNGQNAATPIANTSGRAAMHWNRNVFLADQFSRIMLTAVPTASGTIGPACRINTFSNSMYVLSVEANNLIILKIVSGIPTTLATITYFPTIRDIIEFTAVGNVLQGWINGNVVIFATDTTLTNGNPGVSAAGTTTAGAFTDWVGGTIGTQYRWTNQDFPVTINGQTWQATGVSPNGVPLITRSRLSFTKGTEVGELEMAMASNGSVQINGVPLMQALAQKQFDGATVDLSLVARIPGGTFQGPGTYFFGKVSEVNPGRTICKLTIKDKREEMNQNLPRKVLQQGCGWTLFDNGCTLNSASFAVAGTVSAGSNASQLQTGLTQAGPIPGPATANSLSHTSGSAIPAQTYYVQSTYITAQGETIGGPEAVIALAKDEILVVASPPSATGALSWNCYVSNVSGDEQLQNDAPVAIGTSFTMPNFQQSPATGTAVPTVNETGYFDLGYLVWSAGSANAGTVSAIRSYLTGGVVNFFVPLRNAPVVGDAFTAYPGCDKSQAACTYKFSNLINFGGTPFIPSPETTI